MKNMENISIRKRKYYKLLCKNVDIKYRIVGKVCLPAWQVGESYFGLLIHGGG